MKWEGSYDECSGVIVVYLQHKKIIQSGLFTPFTLACADAELREIWKVPTNILGLRETAAPSYFVPSC